MTEAAIEAAAGQGVEVERDGETMTFRGEDGTEAHLSQGDDLALPPGFPDDVYLPADHSVRSVMDVEGMQIVGMTTAGPLDRVRDEARSTMERHGWKQVLAMEGEKGSMLAYQKDERHAALSFGREGDRVMVNVQLADRR